MKNKMNINATGSVFFNGGTAVTDFVFDKYFDGTIDKDKYGDEILNYTFTPLDELGKYLEENRHLNRLPGKKLTGNLDPAEIDNLLLEKIEESHIYILELKKRIEALEARE